VELAGTSSCSIFLNSVKSEENQHGRVVGNFLNSAVPFSIGLVVIPPRKRDFAIALFFCVSCYSPHNLPAQIPNF